MSRSISHRVPTKILCSGLCLAAFASSGWASTDLYENRQQWEAAAGLPMVQETFESAPLGFFVPPNQFDSGLVAGLASNDVRTLIEQDDPDGFGFVNTTDQGRKYLRYSISDVDDYDTGTYSVRFDVPEETTAFGFDISGWDPLIAAGGTQGQGGATITLFRGHQMVADFFYQSDNAGDLLFLGIIDPGGFDQVRMSIAAFPPQGGIVQSDDVAYDGVTWAVPAPGPVTTGLIAMFGVAGVRRRR